MNVVRLGNDKDLFQKLIKVLNFGGVVMHPTETCYGLAVDIYNKDALARLYKVKKMSLDKPVSILVGSLKMAQEYGEFSEKALELAKKYWPGSLSIVVPRTTKLPEFLNLGQRFVSIRFSSNEFCKKMVLEFGRPVTTTSANISGKYQLYKVDASGLEDVDLVVDGGEIPENKPSTIVKVEGDIVTVLRKGEIEIG